MPGIEWQSISAGLELASAARKLLRAEGKQDRALGDRLARALRTLYFPPDGVLGFLKEMIARKRIEPDQIRLVLTNFNDREWQVQNALETINFRSLADRLELNLVTLRLLDQVRDGKVSLRCDIQDEINFYGQRGIKPDIDRLGELVKGIETLNSAIEEVEALVNARARTLSSGEP